MDTIITIIWFTAIAAGLFFLNKYLQKRQLVNVITYQGLKKLLLWSATLILPFALAFTLLEGLQTSLQYGIFSFVLVSWLLLLFGTYETLRFRIVYDEQGFTYRTLKWQTERYSYKDVDVVTQNGISRKALSTIHLKNGCSIYVSNDMIHTYDFLRRIQ